MRDLRSKIHIFKENPENMQTVVHIFGVITLYMHIYSCEAAISLPFRSF